MATSAESPCSQPYYYGRITRKEAELILSERGCPDGLFLLRDSTKVPGDYVLSLCHAGKYCHYQIQKQIDGRFLIPTTKYPRPGPVEVIQIYRTAPNGLRHALTRPCCRLPCQMPVAFRGVSLPDFDEEVERYAKSMRKVDLEKALGAKRHLLALKVAKTLHEKQPWYHGLIGTVQAKERLLIGGHRQGKFLVRCREDKASYALYISAPNGGFKHYVINVGDDSVGIFGETKFSCLMYLIDYYHNTAGGLISTLQVPVCRPDFERVQFLKYLAISNCSMEEAKNVKRRVRADYIVCSRDGPAVNRPPMPLPRSVIQSSQ